MSDLFGLPDIAFASKDAAKIKRDIITRFESAFFDATGERLTLYPGDPRQLFLSTIADVIVLQRNIIDYTGKQNLLAYAEGAPLEHLGAYMGVTRLPPRRARATLRFTLSTERETATVIPAGTRVTPSGGNTYFTTNENLNIPAGELTGDVPAESLEAGKDANGFLPGQINRLVDPLPYIRSAANITASEGGADIEDDENLRERIHLAPESFSVAGARGAYEFWVKTAHASIVDAAIIGPPVIEPGNVEIYPLLEGGELPTQDILDLVYRICNADDVRPMTDRVRVLSPIPVGYKLSMTYRIHRRDATQATAINSAVGRAVDAWILWQRSKIGRDINPSELIRFVMEAGVKRVEVYSPKFLELSYKELAIIDDPPAIIYGGLEDD